VAERAPKLTRSILKTLTDSEKILVSERAKFLGRGFGQNKIAKAWKLGACVIITTPDNAYYFPLGIALPQST
jgi:hypothetical protein